MLLCTSWIGGRGERGREGGGGGGGGQLPQMFTRVGSNIMKMECN